MLESVMNRRSIRKYTPEPLTAQEIHTLQECAMLAPSAMNRRPWRFVVVTDRAALNALRENHPYAGMLAQAPACVCVCCEACDEAGYWQQDCAAATMNLLIAAREMGLGSCWMGVAPRKERMDAIRRVLHMPESVSPFCLIALGHPAEEPPRPQRWDETMVHENRW